MVFSFKKMQLFKNILLQCEDNESILFCRTVFFVKCTLNFFIFIAIIVKICWNTGTPVLFEEEIMPIFKISA